MSSVTIDSIKLFVTPVERGTSWQEIGDAVQHSDIGPNVGYVSMRPGTKNNFAVVTVNRPQNGSFRQTHLTMLNCGKFIKIWNHSGTRYWKAYLYKPNVKGRDEVMVQTQEQPQETTYAADAANATDAATQLLSSLSLNLATCPTTPPGTPPQTPRQKVMAQDEQISLSIPSVNPSSDEDSDYQEEEQEQEEAGFAIDYVAAGAMEFYAKPCAKRIIIKRTK
jgi:hypothetical protein